MDKNDDDDGDGDGDDDDDDLASSTFNDKGRHGHCHYIHDAHHNEAS